MTENVGAGGVCVLLAEDLGLFQSVETEIIVPGEADPIMTPGTVVWVVRKRNGGRPDMEVFDTGIEFVGIEEKQRERLIAAVDKIIKQRLQVDK